MASDGGTLKGRILVAVVAVLLVVLILRVGGWLLALPVALLAAFGTMEAYRLADPSAETVGWSQVAGAATAALLPILALRADSYVDFAPQAMGALGALAVVSLVLGIAKGTKQASRNSGMSRTAILPFGAAYVGVPLALAVLLHGLPAAEGWTVSGAAAPAGSTPEPAGWLGLFGSADAWAGCGLVMLPLAVTWVGDSAAFLVGRRWGRRRLAPGISPGKTWEGSAAGLLGAIAAAAIWVWLASSLVPGAGFDPVPTVVLGAMTGVCAQVGDLAESLFKRAAGVKDSGSFFLSHGGILDRIDSLLFSFPAAYVAIVAVVAL